MKKLLIILLVTLLLTTFSLSVSQIVLIKYKLAKDYNMPEISTETDIVTPTKSDIETSAVKDNIYNAFCEKLSNENGDFAGWISIDGTNISYPLMMSPSEPDYYLKRDFYRKSSTSGTPYIGSDCDLDSDNTIIYGHNMENGTMFSDLLLYKNEQFFNEHPKVLIQTVSENAEYDIIAVFKEEVHYQDESNVFRYYDYVGDLTEADFDKYVKIVKKISLYDTGVTANYGDKLISLSTCSHLSKNGRFVIVAVKKAA